MTKLDDRWRVPASYEVDHDFGGRVLHRRSLPGVPALNMLSYLEVERMLAEPGPYSALAWQLASDADAVVTDLVMALLEDPSVDRLTCAHVMQVAADPEMRGVQVAKLAWQGLREATEEQRVSAGLMLVSSAYPLSAEKAGQFLDKIETGLAHATPLQRAVYALIRATLSSSPALLDEAHRQFTELDHAFGLAQCALVAHQHELASQKRPELLRAYLEHAIYRYDIGRRESWAARTITYSLIPLLVDVIRADADAVGTWLQRAVTFAAGSQALGELRSAFRIATKLGYTATVSTLEPTDPPQFARHAVNGETRVAVASSVPAAAAASVAAPTAVSAPAEKPAAKKKSKAKGART